MTAKVAFFKDDNGMMDVFKEKFFSWAPGSIIAIFIAVYLCRLTPELGPDSFSYIHFHAIRPPIYPIFIWLFHSFGDYQLTLVMWAQSVFSLAVLIYAQHWLQARLALPKIIIFFILLASSSVIFLHYKTLQTISSEGLAFPYFIIVFFQLVDCFYSYSLKRLFFLVININLLILLRAQFYYLYFFLFILLPWLKWNRHPAKKIILAFALILFSSLMTTALNRSYHYYMHGHFANVPFIGKLSAVQALYLAHRSDASFFAEPNKKLFFENVLTQLENQHLTRDSAPLALDPPLGLHAAYAHYTFAYNEILSNLSKINWQNLTDYQKEQMALAIGKTLYWHHAKENIIFYLWKVGAGFGDTAVFMTFLWILLTCLLNTIRKKNSLSITEVFITLGLVTILVNALFVALFEPIVPFYEFYSYFIIFCLGGLISKHILSQYKDESYGLSK